MFHNELDIVIFDIQCSRLEMDLRSCWEKDVDAIVNGVFRVLKGFCEMWVIYKEGFRTKVWVVECGKCAKAEMIKCFEWKKVFV